MTDQELTALQEQQLEAKIAELRQVHAGLDSEGKSPEARQAAMQAKHDELRSWAEQNDIPLDLLPSPRPPKSTAD